jgi:hypothetical protein
MTSNFVFKCHKIETKAPAATGGWGAAPAASRGKTEVYPVTSISFNHQYKTFATTGSDGHFNFWDKTNRSRLHTSKRFPTSISCSAFNDFEHGQQKLTTMFAYAVSYDWCVRRAVAGGCCALALRAHAVRSHSLPFSRARSLARVG